MLCLTAISCVLNIFKNRWNCLVPMYEYLVTYVQYKRNFSTHNQIFSHGKYCKRKIILFTIFPLGIRLLYGFNLFFRHTYRTYINMNKKCRTLRFLKVHMHDIFDMRTYLKRTGSETIHICRLWRMNSAYSQAVRKLYSQTFSNGINSWTFRTIINNKTNFQTSWYVQRCISWLFSDNFCYFWTCIKIFCSQYEQPI